MTYTVAVMYSTVNHQAEDRGLGAPLAVNHG